MSDPFEFYDPWDDEHAEFNNELKGIRRFKEKDYDYDPLYYHVKIKYREIMHETERALCLRMDKRGKKCFWVPKSIIRNHRVSKKTMYVHEKTWINLKEIKYERRT